MARSKAAKQKQAKKAAAKLKASRNMEHAGSALDSPQKSSPFQQLDSSNASAAEARDLADCIGDDAEAETPIAAASNDRCIMSELLRLSGSMVKSIVHTLIDDYGLTELEIEHTRYIRKDGKAVDGKMKSKPVSETNVPTSKNAAIQCHVANEAQKSHEELMQENKRLRSLLDERGAEAERLSLLVELQQRELQVARTRVAQLDAFMVHEIDQLTSCLPAPIDICRLVQGLQHQYALRESHFASVENSLALEIQMWQEKYAHSEKRQRAKKPFDDNICQKNLIALEDEMGALKEKGVAVKQRLEDCDMLLQMLIECNKDQREADCLQINGLINNVEDLSNVKTAMMDYARTAMIPMENVFAPSLAMSDLSGLSGDQLSLDDSFMGDLQPLMSQLAAEFSASNAPQQQVMVGESPRIIRTP
ncbi:hypothetical protein J3B02_003089, partial [Coemansia erecta]